MTEPQLRTVKVGDLALRTATWGNGPVGIVMLHDGLGSISQWREVPAAIAETTGTAVMAYERAGHGASTPVPSGLWPADWLHREAVAFGQLLSEVGIEEPLVVGHSDGGSVALLHAAGASSCAGVLALAPHSWVETVCTDAIAKMRENADRFVRGLSQHHDAPSELFEAWSGVWVGEEFSRWDIRPLLEAIEVPVLVAQGDSDQYATDAQLFETAAAVGSDTAVEHLAGVGHIIHHEQPETVVSLVADFYRGL